MRTISFIVIMTLLLFALLSGCKKLEEEERPAKPGDLIEVAQDEAEIQNLFEDADKQANEAQSNEEEAQYGTDKSTKVWRPLACNGIVVTIDSLNISEKILHLTLNYDSSSSCYDGRTRAGMVKVYCEGRFLEDSSTRTIIPVGYSVDGNKLEGTKTVTTIVNGDNDYEFSVKVADGKLTKTDGSVITWSSEFVRTWISGFDTKLNAFDDLYEIVGETNGTTSTGKSFIKRISDTKPLQIYTGCANIQGGVVTLSVDNSAGTSIDFGTYNATCDNSATLIYGEYSWPFTQR